MIETIDQYLYDYWGDYPNLAMAMEHPRLSAEAFVAQIVKTADRDGVTLRPHDVAARATEALLQGQGWRVTPRPEDAI